MTCMALRQRLLAASHGQPGVGCMRRKCLQYAGQLHVTLQWRHDFASGAMHCKRLYRTAEPAVAASKCVQLFSRQAAGPLRSMHSTHIGKHGICICITLRQVSDVHTSSRSAALQLSPQGNSTTDASGSQISA